MVEEKDADAGQLRQRSKAHRAGQCFRNFKLVLRGTGILVSLLFVMQAVVILFNPRIEDFWGFCHYIGHGTLGLMMGGFGCYMEYSGLTQRVHGHFGRHTMNRSLLGIFYFWLGSYAMGDLNMQHSGQGWLMMARVTGFVAWAVGVGDICTACTKCSGGDDDDSDEEESKTNEPKAQMLGASGGGAHPTGLPPPPSPENKSVNKVPKGFQEATSPFDEEDGHGSVKVDIKDTDDDVPKKWNSNAFPKPFGGN